MLSDNDRISVPELRKFWEKKTKAIPSSTLPIACAVKTITVDDTTIHQVELQCKCCDSTFILRAAHQCHSNSESGLEWLKTHKGEHVNLSL